MLGNRLSMTPLTLISFWGINAVSVTFFDSIPASARALRPVLPSGPIWFLNEERRRLFDQIRLYGFRGETLPLKENCIPLPLTNWPLSSGREHSLEPETLHFFLSCDLPLHSLTLSALHCLYLYWTPVSQVLEHWDQGSHLVQYGS